MYNSSIQFTLITTDIHFHNILLQIVDYVCAYLIS